MTKTANGALLLLMAYSFAITAGLMQYLFMRSDFLPSSVWLVGAFASAIGWLTMLIVSFRKGHKLAGYLSLFGAFPVMAFPTLLILLFFACVSGRGCL